MEIVIDDSASDQRFDRFLRKWFKKYPQVRLADIYSIIRRWLVKVNKKKVKEKHRLITGDVVYIDDKIQMWTEDLSALFSQKERKLEKVDMNKLKEHILYEDGYWVVFNKPAGIPMHPGNKHRNDLSMNDYIEKYAEEHKTDTFKPSFGYRLDKDTSGVLIWAKTYESLQYINEIVRERAIDKYYLTIVLWKFPKHLIIDKPLLKSYDKKFDRSRVQIDYKEWVASKTECRLDKSFVHPLLGQLSLVRVKIHTWRMHQIRIHVANEWYPVLWDIVYGNPPANRILYKSLHINRQLLHCWKYSFFDSIQWEEMSFESPLPADFSKLISAKK